jgi:pyridoxal 5'-phosphate synthase pdxT subunit
VGVKIGVLALQGDVSEHLDAFRDAFRKSGHENEYNVILVRQAGDLSGLDALVLPGGESTTISRLIDKNGLYAPLTHFEGGIFATCAGMVLMAREVDDPRVHPLGLIDFSVRRNAFGRQRESFEADIGISGLDQPFHGVFIRAPVAIRVGTPTHVLGSLAEGVVAVEQGKHMALSFHPELVKDPRLHIRFLRNCGLI